MDPTLKEPAVYEGRCYTRHYSFPQLCTRPLSKAINNPCYKTIPVTAVDYPERLTRHPLTSKRLKQEIYRQGPGPKKSMQTTDPHLVLLATSSHSQLCLTL